MIFGVVTLPSSVDLSLQGGQQALGSLRVSPRHADLLCQVSAAPAGQVRAAQGPQVLRE